MDELSSQDLRRASENYPGDCLRRERWDAGIQRQHPIDHPERYNTDQKRQLGLDSGQKF